MGNDKKQDDYSFIKEVIKDKPLDKKAIAIKIGAVAGMAILFGVIVSLTIAFLLPRFEKRFQIQEEPPAVDIPSDDETEEEAQETADAEENQPNADAAEGDPSADDASEEAADVQQDLVIGLDDYETFYKDMMSVADEAQRSLVSVLGITSDVDWFNKSYENQEQTTGVIIADNGQELFVLTEYRVVENVDRILVTFADGTSVDARYQKHDKNTGLTILKVALNDVEDSTKEEINVAALGSSSGVAQGQPIMALGSPMGYSDSVAYGNVTSISNKITAIDNQYYLLTTDVSGSSEGSGVLINLNGEIIGIIAQQFSVEGNKNTVTALSISPLKSLLETLSNNEELIYAGIKGQDVTAEISQKTGMPKGVWVDSVEQDSPAMQAGIQNSDIIVKIGDTDIENVSQYHTALQKHKSQDVVKMVVMRQGTEGYVEVSIDVTIAAL